MFYHEQGEERYKIWGVINLYHQGNASELVEALNDKGLITSWNGMESRSVQVLGMVKHLNSFKDSEMDREGYSINWRGNLYATR